MLSVQQTLPEERLRGLVHSYVQREARLADAEWVEPVVARLGSILEFQFADPFDVPIYGVEAPNLAPPVAVIGPITERRARIVMRGHVQALSVVFRPLGLHALFGVPVGPLADFGYEGHGVLGRGVAALHERLGNAGSFAERKVLVDAYFVERLAYRRPVGAAGRALTALMMEERPRVAEVARRAGIGVRQLERLSAEYVGMTPRMFVRIARFQRAMRMKLDGRRPWTEVAHAAEYHDQMHMIRDFRAFAGGSPGQVLAQTEARQLSRLGL